MNKVTLYVGANNQTKIVEVSKMQKVLDKYFMGYTIIPCRGRWQGTNEKSVQVQIFDDKYKVDDIVGKVRELKTVLVQDVILADINNEVHFIWLH